MFAICSPRGGARFLLNCNVRGITLSRMPQCAYCDKDTEFRGAGIPICSECDLRRENEQAASILVRAREHRGWCDEKVKLLREWSDAIQEYAKALEEHHLPSGLSAEKYREARRLAEAARAKAEFRRLAMKAHEEQHGCQRLP